VAIDRLLRWFLMGLTIGIFLGMSESSNARFPRRYSLRALLMLMLLAAVLIPVGQRLWRQHVMRRDRQTYVTLQDTKVEQVEKARAQLQEGLSTVIDGARPIPDDFVVLVRQGDTFGCFIPRNQFKKGESLEYDWYYRTDGQARFAADSPNLVAGHSFAGPYVSGKMVYVTFGPLSIQWSGNGPGWGFLYYDSNSPAPVGICSTDQRVVDYIDGKDPKWDYKSDTDKTAAGSTQQPSK
jgi:hypothetical protein